MKLERFKDEIRKETEFSRFGSLRALYVETRGQTDKENVLRATTKIFAAEMFETVADDETGNVAEVFAETADEEYDHHWSVLAELEAYEQGRIPAVAQHLRNINGTVEPIGGSVERTLAAEKSKEDIADFFAGQDDTPRCRSSSTV